MRDAVRFPFRLTLAAWCQQATLTGCPRSDYLRGLDHDGRLMLLKQLPSGSRRGRGLFAEPHELGVALLSGKDPRGLGQGVEAAMSVKWP